MRTPLAVTCTLALWLGALGCQEPQNPYDLAIDQRSTGLAVPTRIDRITKRVATDEEEAKTVIAKMPTMADKLNDPTDWVAVLEVVEAADAAGKDAAYGANRRELRIAAQFIEDEKEEIQKKIGGAVDYAAKQKGCEVEAWGAVKNGFDKAIEERFKERLEESNDAFLVIDRNQESLGKKNLPAIEEIAGEIAGASYIVHYALPQAKLELEAMVAAAADAREEIQKLLEEEKEPRREGSKTNPEMDKRKLERVKNAEAQLIQLDRVENDAKASAADIEQRTASLKASYDEALGKLEDAIKAKKPS